MSEPIELLPGAAPGASRTGAVSSLLAARIRKGEIEQDPVQATLARKLDDLAAKLETRTLASKSSSLGWLFSRQKKAEPIRGLYIHGAVGRGKSMLMDLFFRSVNLKKKRRAHFHDFMADAQERIHRQRQAFKNGETKEEDPMPPVARELAAEAMLLCFDEFTVTDIADAMILGRLFKGLFEAGVVVVATSNVAPDDLYKDGLNRQLFLPFIGILKTHCSVHWLDARTDYRLEKLSKAPVYISPLGDEAEIAMEEAWQRMTAGSPAAPGELEVKGRKVPVPMAAGGSARFTFADLCEQPLGARDYLAITRNYHTVFVENVPLMDRSVQNHAKRFINLIDTLYDNGTRLVISAEGPPEALYSANSGTEAFEFSRTVSRLHEMQSVEYLAAKIG